ncbi:type IV secretion system DNA-binding domain-containing protein [Nitratireductor sp. CAU 1489]|uniref:Type IV secretion system DNA-binding domain-containing protein n=1 Tax=Nitratireductor arenosus TaxID=2682096 RepID=A0A844QCU0_9HYPH|nr:type IV secretion system DNA-binding domain-containing protein [Nitratireductor arenosus]MVA95649.1 type IV secretion system DNA-binding domain-containing protein [Nitratireductor arenosus]
MSAANNPVTILGTTVGRRPYRRFGIHLSDRLFHQYIIGQTGTGKSTLMLNMMRQDIAVGQGFCVIDPHGDLAQEVVGIAKDDAVYWDAAGPACSVGYNPMTFVAEQYRPLVASGLIDTLKKQWADAWGARMEHLLRHALLALLSRPRSNLQDIIPMFLQASFRKEVLAEVSDEQVRRFWTAEFPKMNYKTAADGVAPIANKLGAFLAHPAVRKAVCEPEQPLRFRELMDQGRTLVVNLAKGRLGAGVANILGGLIVSSLGLAAYSRQSQPIEERKPYFLYIDEFHSFTTTAFTEMLSELRKYGLGLVLSHQHTSQLDSGVLDAILGNVGTLLAFRVGANDGTILAKQLASDVPEPPDLVSLPNHEMYLKVMIAGTQSKAFSAGTINYDMSQ